jgi:ubiquinone/menaquinone biosynthesis C-methylase UbiE
MPTTVEDPSDGAPRGRPTPTRIRVMGRMLNRLVVRAPWAWPLVRAPMRRFFERSAPGWDERTGAGSVDHLAPLAAALLHVKPAPERALEVGTGTGAGALLIAREFPQASVRGVDLSEEMIRGAKQKVGLDPTGRVAFRVADAANLPYEDESFDLVAHLNMPPFTAEVARVLRPAGQAIVASSWGSATPFYTPNSVLDWGFAKAGIEPVAAGEAGDGAFWVGRKLRA